MVKSCYKILPRERVIIEYLNGQITWSDLLEMKKREVSDSNYNPNYNVIADIRDIEIDIEDLDGIDKYLKYLKSNNKSVGNRKTAILTENSKQVTHSEYLRFINIDLPIDLKTVSTYYAAFEWIEIDHVTRAEVYNYLEGLREGAFQVAVSSY